MHTHRNLDLRGRKNNKLKVWLIIILIVTGFFTIIYLAFLTHGKGTTTTTPETNGTVEETTELKDGTGLSVSLLSLFNEYKNIIGSTQTDTNQNHYTIANFYFVDRPLFT